MIACASAGALAQAAGRVVLVRAPGDDAIASRLRSELAASAFDVVELSASDPSARAPLAQLATERQASAALRMRVDRTKPSAVELWSVSGQTEASGTLEAIAVPAGEQQSAEVLALRTVETLRARMLGFVAPRPPPVALEPEPEPEPEPQRETVIDQEQPSSLDAPEATGVDRPEPERPRALWLELAPALALDAGGLGPQLAALLALRLDATQLISVSVFGVAPLWRAELIEQEGGANVSTWLLGAAIDAQLRWRIWALSVGVGLASVLTPMSGAAAPPFEGDDELETSAAPMLRAALYLELATWLRVAARGALGFAVPEIAVRFEDREVARWGQPFALVGVGLELLLARP